MCASAHLEKGVTREFIVIHQRKGLLPCLGTPARAENSMEYRIFLPDPQHSRDPCLDGGGRPAQAPEKRTNSMQRRDGSQKRGELGQWRDIPDWSGSLERY